MVVLHPSMILLGRCGLLLQPRYYSSIIGYLLDDLGQLCPLQLDQTFPIELIPVLATIDMCIILLYRPQVLLALAA